MYLTPYASKAIIGRGAKEGKATIMKNLDLIRKQLSPARRKRIAVRAATLIAEEKSLQELRQAHKLTQKRMAQVLGIGQDLSLIHISEPTRLGMISYAVF